MVEETFLQGAMLNFIYSLVIVAISTTIYLQTREIDKLSSYKGISFFRNAFLSFGIAYFFKLLFDVLVVSDILNPSSIFNPLLLAAIMYFNLMAAIYLVLSINYKKKHSKLFDNLFLINSFAMLISLAVLFANNYLIYVIVQMLVVVIWIISILRNRESKNKNMKAVYSMLLLFWAVSILDLFVPSTIYIQLLVYILSIVIFLVILYKVIKSLRRR